MKIIQYTLGMSNGFFIRDRGVIAVDCGSELGAGYFLEACKSGGIDTKEITLIVTTHEHVDHIINLGAMRAVTKAPILCHRNAALSLRLGLHPVVAPRNAVGRKVLSEMNPDEEPCPYLPPIEPDLIFEGEFDLSPYGVDARLIETPGHSKSCISVVTSDRQAIVGDLLVDDFTGSATLAFLCYGDVSECNPVLFKSCEKLLEAADTFYSGHGGPFTHAEFETALRQAREEASSGGTD